MLTETQTIFELAPKEPTKTYSLFSLDEFSPESGVGLNVVTQPAFKGQWTPLPQKPTVRPDNYFELRQWQEECFTELKDAGHWIINAPMAAGKSFMISCLATNAIQNRNKRVVIAVPQTIIGQGFVENHIHISDSERFIFRPHTLLDGENQNVLNLLAFLNASTKQEIKKNNTTYISKDSVIVCTHATLVRAFQNDPNSFKNCLVVIDEAHHICAHTDTQFSDLEDDSLDSLEDIDEYDEDEVEEQKQANKDLTNKLGAFLSHVLGQTDVEVGLTTATPFRGDKMDILPEQDRAKFKTYKYAFDLFLKSCKYLKELQYDFMFQDDNKSYFAALESEFSIPGEEDKKTIIFIPHVSQIEDKHEFVLNIYRAITRAKSKQDVIIEDKKAYCMVYAKDRPEKKFRVVNLVDVDNREAKKDFIKTAHDHQDGSLVDIIIALNMFQEGASWRWGQKMFLMGARNSLTQTIQMVGRLFRDAPGKESVCVKHVLPCYPKNISDKEEFKDTLNDYMKAFFGALLLENILLPVMLKVPKKDGTVRRIKTDYILELFGDKALAIEEDLHSEWIGQGVGDLEDVQEAIALAEKVTERFLQEKVNKGSLDARVLSEVEEIVRCLFAKIERSVRYIKNNKCVPCDGLNVEDIDLDLVSINPLKAELEYISHADLQTLELIKAAIGNRFYLSYEESKAIVLPLNLSSQTEFFKKSKELNLSLKGVPKDPQGFYNRRGTWLGWPDFLRNEKKPDLSYEECKEIVVPLNLSSEEEFHKKHKELNLITKGIPKDPYTVYKPKGTWVNWPDFLRNEKKPEFITYEECKEIVIPLNFSSREEFHKKHKELNLITKGIPANPEGFYERKGTWLGWYDFLGKHKPEYDLSYEECKEIVQSLNLSSEEEFKEKHKELNLITKGIPANPEGFYKSRGTWIDWYDFLGKNKPEYDLSYEESKAIILSLNFSSREEFFKKHKELNLITKGVPKDPEDFYKSRGTWIDWYDFLGKHKTEYSLSYEECKEIILPLNLSSQKEFDKKHKELNLSTKGVPKAPDIVYNRKGTWLGWDDFLRNEKKPEFITYEECKEIVQALNISSREEFDKKHKELNLSLKGVPKDPQGFYNRRGTWLGWDDFLRNEKKPEFITYEECKEIVIPLNFSSREEFFKKHKELNLSLKGIPKNPCVVYKARGTWLGWPDFLGKTK